jgi:hypothetical protein
MDKSFELLIQEGMNSQWAISKSIPLLIGSALMIGHRVNSNPLVIFDLTAV